VFGNVKAPANKGGRPRTITPMKLKALCNYLLEKPNLYFGKMAIFLWHEFALQVTKSNINRALITKDWLNKVA
jgi:hypothetical protein